MHPTLREVIATAAAASLALSTGCGGSDSAKPSQPSGPPTVSLSAATSTGYVGQQVFLTWSSTNAASCTASGAWSGSQSTSGNQNVTAAVAGAQMYSLTCTGPQGSASASTTFTASPPNFSLSNSFTPNNVTIPTSEGSAWNLGDLWLGKTALGRVLSYGPAKLQFLNICLSAQVGFNNCYKSPPVTGPLSPQMLAGIDAGIAAYEGTGARVILNFFYKWDASVAPPGATDPSLDVVLSHLDQLAPVVLKHRDIIFGMYAGFFGEFGQWVNATNGLDTSAAAHKQLLDKELSYFKGMFPIFVPWVGDYIRYAGGRVIIDGLGLQDDNFDSAVGTAQAFFNRDFPADGSILMGEDFASNVSATSVLNAEFNGSSFPTQSCPVLDSLGYRFHVQGFDIADFPRGIWTTLEANGCGMSFLNKVGTRIELQSAKMFGNPTAGGSLLVELTMLNAGYGRVVRARPATVVFTTNGQIVGEAPINLEDFDLRRLSSRGGPRTFQFSVTVPTGVLAGSSTSVAIRIPDPAASLALQAAYSLPLNSLGSDSRAIFDPTTGLNSIALIAAR